MTCVDNKRQLEEGSDKSGKATTLTIKEHGNKTERKNGKKW